MIAISNIDLYNLLRAKLGDAEAKSVTDYIDVQVSEKFEKEKQIFAAKDDIGLLREDIAKLEGRLETKIAETKVDIIKWVFAMFAAMALMIIGLYFKK